MNRIKKTEANSLGSIRGVNETCHSQMIRLSFYESNIELGWDPDGSIQGGVNYGVMVVKTSQPPNFLLAKWLVYEAVDSS